MSGDVGDLFDGLFELLDIGPGRYDRQWPLWRRCCWLVWRVLWIVLVLVVVLGLIVALIMWLVD